VNSRIQYVRLASGSGLIVMIDVSWPGRWCWCCWY